MEVRTTFFFSGSPIWERSRPFPKPDVEKKLKLLPDVKSPMAQAHNENHAKKRDEIPTIWGVNALTTGNPFLGTNVLEVSVGRDFGALKGLRIPT